MSTDVCGTATASRMPLGTRIWGWLGFGMRNPDMMDLDEAPGYAAGYFEIQTYVRLDWRDRLRVMLSGNLAVVTRSKTDVLVGRGAITRAEIGIVAPDRKFVDPSRGFLQ